MSPTTKKLLLGSMVLAGALTFTVLPASSSGPFDGTGQSGTGGGAPRVSVGGKVYLDHPADSVYLTYDGGSIGLVGAEVDVPNGFTDSQKVNPDTIITPYSVVPQAASGQAAFRVAQTGARVYFDVGGNIYCASDGSQVVCGSAWAIQSFSVDTIGTYTAARNKVEIFYPQPYPLGSLASCSSGFKGRLETLSTDGELYSCNGTTTGRIAKMASWSASLNFGTITARGCSDLTITATGAAKDEPIALGGCGSVQSADAHLSCTGSFTATNVATVRLCCHDNADCADLPAITFTAVAIR